MATKMATTSQQPTRSSQETERRHLLSPSSQQTTPAPSAATSIIDFDPGTTSGQTTPRARSPAPSYRTNTTTASTSTSQAPPQQQQQPQPYRGFPSEAAYLQALNEWAESKKFVEPETGLKGFYGEVTMQEYSDRPKLELGVRRKVRGWRARRKEGR